MFSGREIPLTGCVRSPVRLLPTRHVGREHEAAVHGVAPEARGISERFVVVQAWVAVPALWGDPRDALWLAM